MEGTSPKCLQLLLLDTESEEKELCVLHTSVSIDIYNQHVLLL